MKLSLDNKYGDTNTTELNILNIEIAFLSSSCLVYFPYSHCVSRKEEGGQGCTFFCLTLGREGGGNMAKLHVGEII